MVKFTSGNRKLNALALHLGLKKSQVVCADLPAGFSCPKADICKTYANKETGKMIRVGRIKCYAAKTEVFAPSVRRLRWENYDKFLSCGDNVDMMVSLILQAIMPSVKIVRIHSSGDFFSLAYFQAWIEVARLKTDILFFGYTKSLDYAKTARPSNFALNYSFGSKDDDRWTSDVPTCFIRETPEQYTDILTSCATHEKAHEDYYAIFNGETFAIGVH